MLVPVHDLEKKSWPEDFSFKIRVCAFSFDASFASMSVPIIALA
jgi:hypothetical protein